MRTLIVFESMFGNTARVARAVAEGFARSAGEPTLMDVGDAAEVPVAGAPPETGEVLDLVAADAGTLRALWSVAGLWTLGRGGYGLFHAFTLRPRRPRRHRGQP